MPQHSTISQTSHVLGLSTLQQRKINRLKKKHKNVYHVTHKAHSHASGPTIHTTMFLHKPVYKICPASKTHLQTSLSRQNQQQPVVFVRHYVVPSPNQSAICRLFAAVQIIYHVNMTWLIYGFFQNSATCFKDENVSILNIFQSW